MIRTKSLILEKPNFGDNKSLETCGSIKRKNGSLLFGSPALFFHNTI